MPILPCFAATFSIYPLETDFTDMQTRSDIKDFTLSELREQLETEGLAPYRANQILK